MDLLLLLRYSRSPLPKTGEGQSYSFLSCLHTPQCLSHEGDVQYRDGVLCEEGGHLPRHEEEGPQTHLCLDALPLPLSDGLPPSFKTSCSQPLYNWSAANGPSHPHPMSLPRPHLQPMRCFRNLTYPWNTFWVEKFDEGQAVFFKA